MDNRLIARRLVEHAHGLEAEQASLYRIRAYRRAAAVVLGLDQPVAELVAAEGERGLEALPGIGRRLSRVIADLARGEEGSPAESGAGQEAAPSLP